MPGKVARRVTARTPVAKTYRERADNPALRLWQSDLQAIRDQDARQLQAVKALEDVGYVVHLERGCRTILPSRPKPDLRIVKDGDPD